MTVKVHFGKNHLGVFTYCHHLMTEKMIVTKQWENVTCGSCHVKKKWALKRLA